ncbi:unnamed protein product [Vitrella brassicaformis CCMP3155]|uniref:Uncharacterized protein n=4 Tax=Vitrella brassicaformis TaxID=1169539 RepID=A0A0G4F9H9_VITBC|nr:unnamed protein product [Vitrella brassicaformis CCMP3155]|eukprot:CEM09543.1 unnamed protein product [Vitrella brassicaformis CCMP3155]
MAASEHQHASESSVVFPHLSGPFDGARLLEGGRTYAKEPQEASTGPYSTFGGMSGMPDDIVMDAEFRRELEQQKLHESLKARLSLEHQLSETRDRLIVTDAKKQSFKKQAREYEAEIEKLRATVTSLQKDTEEARREAIEWHDRGEAAVNQMKEMRETHLQEVRLLQRGLRAKMEGDDQRNKTDREAQVLERLSKAAAQREESYKEKNRLQAQLDKAKSDCRLLLQERHALREKVKRLSEEVQHQKKRAALANTRDAQLYNPLSGSSRPGQQAAAAKSDSQQQRKSPSPVSPLSVSWSGSKKGRRSRGSNARNSETSPAALPDVAGALKRSAEEESDEEFEKQLQMVERRFEGLGDNARGLDEIVEQLQKEKHKLENARTEDRLALEEMSEALREWQYLCDQKEQLLIRLNEALGEATQEHKRLVNALGLDESTIATLPALQGPPAPLGEPSIGVRSGRVSRMDHKDKDVPTVALSEYEAAKKESATLKSTATGQQSLITRLQEQLLALQTAYARVYEVCTSAGLHHLPEGHLIPSDPLVLIRQLNSQDGSLRSFSDSIRQSSFGTPGDPNRHGNNNHGGNHLEAARPANNFPSFGDAIHTRAPESDTQAAPSGQAQAAHPSSKWGHGESVSNPGVVPTVVMGRLHLTEELGRSSGASVPHGSIPPPPFQPEAPKAPAPKEKPGAGHYYNYYIGKSPRESDDSNRVTYAASSRKTFEDDVPAEDSGDGASRKVASISPSHEDVADYCVNWLVQKALSNISAADDPGFFDVAGTSISQSQQDRYSPDALDEATPEPSDPTPWENPPEGPSPETDIVSPDVVFQQATFAKTGELLQLELCRMDEPPLPWQGSRPHSEGGLPSRPEMAGDAWELRAHELSTNERFSMVIDEGILTQLDQEDPWRDLFSLIGLTAGRELVLPVLVGRRRVTLAPAGVAIILSLYRYDAYRFFLNGYDEEGDRLADLVLLEDQLGAADKAHLDLCNTDEMLFDFFVGNLTLHEIKLKSVSSRPKRAAMSAAPQADVSLKLLFKDYHKEETAGDEHL